MILYLILYLILLFVNILLCFFAFPLITFGLGGLKKETIISFGLGALIYPIGEMVIRSNAMRILQRATINSSVWSEKWSYGILMGLSAAFIGELLCFIVLLYCNHSDEWNGTIIWNTSLALGRVWSTAIITWGWYMLKAFVGIISGQSVEWYGYSVSDLCAGMLERVIYLVLFAGLTYIIQSGFENDYFILITVLAIVIHAVAEMMLYYLKYWATLPIIIVEIGFAVFSFVVVSFGYKFLQKTREGKLQ